MPLPALTQADIAARLTEVSLEGVHNPFPQGFFKESPRPAAVLIPFTCIDQKWHLLFIRRTHNENDRHAGQVAFPGGRVDATDPDVYAAALREANEEVGLHPADVEIIGRMQEFHSVTNYIVTPVVGVFPWPYTFQIDPMEVSRAFLIPLDWLADPDNRQVIKRHFPKSRAWPVIYFDPYDGEALWGFTAQVVVQLLALLESDKAAL